MSVLSSFAAEGRSARRGVIILFGFTGFVLLYWWRELGPDYLRIALGLPCLAVSFGLWRNRRWARWVAMGACFITVVVAFAMPVLLVLWRPFETFEQGATQATLFSCATAAAIGVIGYKGLGYFRSPAAWSAFSNNAREQAALAGEGSAKVVVSALCIALVLCAVAAARGTPGPKPIAVPGVSNALPDLVVNSLCLSGENLVRAEVRNRGNGTGSGRYRISFSDLRGRGGNDSSWGTVPAPGQSTWIALNNAVNQTESDGAQQFVFLEVDSDHDIAESIETNNRVLLDIVYDHFYPGNLPRCP